MKWTQDLWFFLGGLFLVNAIPHFVSGLMGKRFQTPFAKPPGKGLSSATVNVLWGFLNIVAAYIFLFCLADFDLQPTVAVIFFFGGVLLSSVLLARMFGKLHGS